MIYKKAKRSVHSQQVTISAARNSQDSKYDRHTRNTNNKNDPQKKPMEAPPWNGQQENYRRV